MERENVNVQTANAPSSSLSQKTGTMTKLRKKQLVFIWGMMLLPLLQWLIFFAYVNVDSVLMAFQFKDSVSGEIIFSFNNFRRFFSEATQLEWFKICVGNSLKAGLNDLFLSAISLFCAYWFYKKMPGRGVFRFIFYLPSIISIVIYTTVFKYMFNMSFGPVNILLQDVFELSKNELPQWFGDKDLSFSLVLFYCIWVGLGYNVLILGGAMENISPDVMEYSRMEGVGPWRELFQIVVPMMWPTIAVCFLSAVTIIFTLFVQVDLLTKGGPDGSSETIGYKINSLIRSGYHYWGACVGIGFTVIATPIIVLVKKGTDKASESFGF